jgi:serine/threonine-protein kinase
MEPPLQTLAAGTTFAGRYRIIEELAAGGMGRIYRASDSQAEEEVVLKLIRPEIASQPSIITRFRNELKLTRKIVHKNVARVFDINQWQGVSFITMEYVRGEDLKRLIRKVGRMSPAQGVSIAAQICDGLAEAHRLGVIHRDLKPQNILIDESGGARIVDFGIARSPQAESLTDPGVMIGTPQYMPPEQAEGEEVDERSDLYALGVVLYEMLTGELPFKGESPLAVAMKHKSEPPTDPRILNPQIPEDLARSILRCLEKDPGQRPASATALKNELEHIRDSLTTSMNAPQLETKAPGRKPVPRPLLYGAGALLLIILFAAGYYGIKSLSAPESGRTSGLQPAAPSGAWQNSIAVLPFRDLSPAQDQEHLCFGMTEALIDRLSRIGSLKVISPASVMRYKGQDKDIITIGEELGVTNILEGSVQVEGDRIRIRGQLTDTESGFTSWTDSFEDRLTSIIGLQDQVSRDIAEALKMRLAPDSLTGPAAGKPVSFPAYELYIKGMNYYFSRYLFTREPEDFEDAVAMIRQALEVQPDYAEALAGLGWVHTLQFVGYGDPQDLKQTITYGRRAYEADPESAFANALVGIPYLFSGEYDRVYDHLKIALALNPNKPEVQFIAGVFLRWMGLCSQASAHLQKGLDLDPYDFFSAGGLATSQAQCGNGEIAAQYYMRAVEINPNPPVLWTLVKMLLGTGQTQAAEEIFHRVELENPEHEGLERTRALLLAARGEREKALALDQNFVIYAILGMQDQALEEMERMVENSSTELPYLELVNLRLYDGLRDNPRFQALLAKRKPIYEERLVKFGDL